MDYERGRVFWSHAGAFSLGARSVVNLLPAKSLGIVVLANAFPTGIPEGIAASFYDLVLSGKVTRDWIAFWNKPYEALFQSFGASAAQYARPPVQVSPALPPSAYVGIYATAYFGNIEIVESAGGLVLRLGPQKRPFPLKHYDRDVFTYVPDPEPPAPPYGVTFWIGPDRKAQQVVLENLNTAGQGTFTRVSRK